MLSFENMNEERILMLRKFIEEEPNNPFNTYALAMEYYDSNPERALEILMDLAKKSSSYLPTYFKLSHLLWEMEEWNLAEQMFLEGIKIAGEVDDIKALSELKSAYQNFLFEKE